MDKFVKIKGLASVGTSDIVGSGITALFWFYIASVLEPSQYGEISYYIGIVGIFSLVALVGARQTITVYVAKNIKIQSTLYLISLVAGVILSLVLIVIFYRIDTSLLLFGYIINTLAIGELLGRKSYFSYFKYNLIQKCLTAVLGVGFYFLFGPDGIIYALALSYAAFIIRIVKEFKIKEIGYSFIKSRMGFITNNYVINLLAINGSVDKVILLPILGFAILGNYALSLQIISALLILPNIVYRYILPQDASGSSNSYLRKLTIIISVGISIFGIVIAPYIFQTLFPKYVEVSDAIQIMCIGIIPTTVSLLYTSKFLGLEKSKFVLISRAISLGITIVGMIILGTIFGINGVAMAFVLASTAPAVYLVIMDKIVNRVN